MLREMKMPRFIGIYENKTKKNYDLDILAAVYLHVLKKVYEMYEKKELVLKDDYFIITLADMAWISRISLYYQEKAIQELESRGGLLNMTRLNLTNMMRVDAVNNKPIDIVVEDTVSINSTLSQFVDFKKMW